MRTLLRIEKKVQEPTWEALQVFDNDTARITCGRRWIRDPLADVRPFEANVRMSSRLRTLIGWVLIGLLCACGDDGDATDRNAGSMIDAAGSDSNPDSESDAVTGSDSDAGSDAGTRTGSDAGSDAGTGSSTDAKGDGGSADAGSAQDGTPHFTDVTATSGLQYRQAPAHAPGEPSEWYAVHGLEGDAPYMSGGAAVADFDGDGWMDLYVTRLDKFGLLFRNRGDGTFEDVTEAAGLNLAGFRGMGPVWADVDNDGDPDLYLTTLWGGRYWLFINEGGVFTEEAEARGAAVESLNVHQGFSASAGDYDLDGWVDLHTCEWTFDLSSPTMPSHSRLLRNLGAGGASMAGTFEDATTAAGVELWNALDVGMGDFAFASTFSDLDGDGWPDLYVASDFGSSRLFWNDGDGGFTEGAAAAGVGTAENAMGLTAGDYDGDGDLDLFVTSIQCTMQEVDTIGCTGNRLYRNEGARTFTDQTDRAGVRNGRWGWGTSFFDYDNDGDLDLAMTNGVRFQGAAFSGFGSDIARFWRNDGDGVMGDATADVGFLDTGDGKGLLTFDYDNDGDLDMFVVNHVAGGTLYRNDGGNQRASLRIRLQGTTSNRDALGARVSVIVNEGDDPLVRELRGGSNYLSQNEPVLHFGLGERDEGAGPVHEVRVDWPRPAGRAVQVISEVGWMEGVVEVVEE